MSTAVTIGELARAGVLEFGDGYRTRKDELDDTGFRILRAADVRDGYAHLDGEDFVSVANAAKIGAKAAQQGDVVLTTKGTVGRVATVPPLHEPAVYSPQLCYFRVRAAHVLDARFLRYWLRSPQFQQQSSYLQGNTDMAPYISLRDLASTRIALPPVEDQRNIGELLGALDDKIEANRKLAATSDALAHALVRQAILRNDRQVRLDTIASHHPGKYLSRDAYSDEGNFPVFGSNSHMGYVDRPLVGGPMAVLARIGSSCGSIRWSHRDAWINNNASAIIPIPGFPPEVLRYVLRHVDMTPYRAGSGQPFIRVKELLETHVAVPSDADSLRIARILRDLSEYEYVCQQESLILGSLRDTLLPKLMSGALKVREAQRLVAQAV